MGLRILTFTSLYPSAARPRNGIFVENRLRRLVESGSVDARVVAPVPWFPWRSDIFGEYGRVARTPRSAKRYGIDIQYPRYLMIPKVGMALQPLSMALGAGPCLEAARRSGGEFDLIDAHYFYPDGVAAAELAGRIEKPLVITARGSDINLIAQLPGPRKAILRAAKCAAEIIAVSNALGRAMIEIGIDESKITVIRNGVDLDLFYPEDRYAARGRLSLSGGAWVASVGNLVPEKGHDLVLRAVARLSSVSVLIVGRGPERMRLLSLSRELGIESRVRFLDEMPQEQLRAVYSAVDCLALGSSREGWPNVVLESLACGTPVAAFDVGGVREIIQSTDVGTVVELRSDAALAAALGALLKAAPSREVLRRYAEKFGWDLVVEEQLAVYERALGPARHSPVDAEAHEQGCLR